MNPSNYIYLGIKAHVVCINANSGEEIWRTKVKKSELIPIIVLDDLIIAHAHGHLFGLNKKDGAILWENGLKGLGYGYCLMGAEGNVTTTQMQSFIAHIAAEKSTASDGDSD